MTKQVLVFGAEGFIGKVLTRKLLEHPHYEPVRIFRRGASQVVATRDEEREFGSFEQLQEYLGEFLNAKLAINAAALTTKEDSYAAIQALVSSNVAYTATLAKLCHQIGVERLVHFGTYSTSTDGVNPLPQTLYAATKAASYEVLRYFSSQKELKVVVIEPFDIYSADHPHGKVISLLVDSLTNGYELELTKGHQELAPIHALDVAEAAISSLTLEVSGDFSLWSLPGPEVYKLRELAVSIAKALGKENNLQNLNFRAAYKSNEIMRVSTRHRVLPFKPQTRLRHGLFLSALET